MDENTLSLSVAGGLATLLVLLVKALFAAARGLAEKTPTEVDDDIVKKTRDSFKEKSRDL